MLLALFTDNRGVLNIPLNKSTEVHTVSIDQISLKGKYPARVKRSFLFGSPWSEIRRRQWRLYTTKVFTCLNYYKLKCHVPHHNTHSFCLWILAAHTKCNKLVCPLIEFSFHPFLSESIIFPKAAGTSTKTLAKERILPAYILPSFLVKSLKTNLAGVKRRFVLNK